MEVLGAMVQTFGSTLITSRAPDVLKPENDELQHLQTNSCFWSWRKKTDPLRASLVTQSVKNLPAMQETQVRSLGWEDPLEKEMATQSSILA